MADIASRLLDFPPQFRVTPEEFDKRIKAHLNLLGQISIAKLAVVDADQDLLEILNPSVNSISYLYVLRNRIETHFNAKGKASQSNDAAIIAKIIDFLSNFDSLQGRYVGPELRKLVEFMFKQGKTYPNLRIHAVNAIRSAILRLDPTGGTLTTNHLFFTELCLATRSYKEALPVLEKVIHSFPGTKATITTIDGPFPCSPHADSSNYITENSGLTGKLEAVDVHEYFLMGAMVYIGLRRWEDALLYLQLVLTSPTSGNPSGLMLEAYQKWVLVECIVNGKGPDASRIMQQSVVKCVIGCSKAYDSLANIFQSRDLARLQAEIAAGTQIWYEDGNLGLVQQLVSRMPRFFVISLQKTYSAIPLSKVAGWLQQPPDQTHAFIEDLITTGALNASIDLRDGPNQGAVLRFFSNRSGGPNGKSEEELHAKLVRQTARTNQMMEYVKMADRRLVLTKEYVDSFRKRRSNKDEEHAGLDGVAMDTNPEWSSYQDEDLMIDS